MMEELKAKVVRAALEWVAFYERDERTEDYHDELMCAVMDLRAAMLDLCVPLPKGEDA